MRYASVAEHRDQLRVRSIYIQPSGLYAWQKSPLSQRAREAAQQTEFIRQAWNDSRKVYGYRKLHDELLEHGRACCPNRVARLRVSGPRSATGAGLAAMAANSQQHAGSPVRRGCAKPGLGDRHHLSSAHWSFAYLAIVIAPYSRRVVGWSMQSRQTTDVALQALHMAVWRRKPKWRGLIHSDQGSQFTSMDWAAFIRAHNLEHSMSRRGNCHDNAEAESFFNLLKR